MRYLKQHTRITRWGGSGRLFDKFRGSEFRFACSPDHGSGVRGGGAPAGRVTAVIATGKRPVPFRTRKLSLSAPMVLHSTGCGRVGHRRTPVTGGLHQFWWGPPAFVVCGFLRCGGGSLGSVRTNIGSHHPEGVGRGPSRAWNQCSTRLTVSACPPVTPSESSMMITRDKLVMRTDATTGGRSACSIP